MNGASSDTKTSAKSFIDFPNTSRDPPEDPFNGTFSNKIGNISLFHFHLELTCKPRRPKR